MWWEKVMKAAICATSSGMDSCKAALEKPEQAGYWFGDRTSQGQGLLCENRNGMGNALSSPDKMGLAREVSVL